MADDPTGSGTDAADDRHSEPKATLALISKLQQFLYVGLHICDLLLQQIDLGD